MIRSISHAVNALQKTVRVTRTVDGKVPNGIVPLQLLDLELRGALVLVVCAVVAARVVFIARVSRDLGHGLSAVSVGDIVAGWFPIKEGESFPVRNPSCKVCARCIRVVDVQLSCAEGSKGEG